MDSGASALICAKIPTVFLTILLHYCYHVNTVEKAYLSQITPRVALGSDIPVGQQAIRDSVMQEPPAGCYSCLFFFFRAAPAAHGSSQARGWIGAAGTSLHHSHSNTRSQLHPRPTPQLMTVWILNPPSKARDRNLILMDSNCVRNPLSHNRNSQDWTF